jgi:hypothetical protein
MNQTETYTILGGRYDGLSIRLHPIEAIGLRQEARVLSLEQKAGFWPVFTTSFAEGENPELNAVFEVDPCDRTATFIEYRECKTA